MEERGVWIPAIELAQLPEEGMRQVTLKGISILLVRRKGDVYALSNRCPHIGCALSQGVLEADAVRCVCHDWTIDFRTGELTMSREVKVPTYRTKVENGKLFVLLEE